jgi:NADH dehydrogenase subunit E (EC 1.6.5.3)
MSYTTDVEARLRTEAAEVIGRYPTGHSRSALLPLLHLVQSEDGYVSADGIALCADLLGLTRAEVSAVATFYTQYKRHPTGEYLVGVCTNALCAVMGGDEIWEAVAEHVGVGSDETSESGRITLERIECNAACDYAPVVMVNWEFFDNQTPGSAVALVDDIEAGRPLHPTRGADVVSPFTAVEHVLAGFPDGHADEGPSAGENSLLGLRIAEANDWHAPVALPEAALPQDAPVAGAAATEGEDK